MGKSYKLSTFHVIFSCYLEFSIPPPFHFMELFITYLYCVGFDKSVGVVSLTCSRSTIVVI